MTTPGRSRARTPDGGVLTQLVRARRIGPRAVDAVRQDIERDSRLGIGYLGIGAVIVGIMMLIRGLVSFAWTWAANDWRLLTLVAWVIVIAAFAAVVLMARRSRGVLAPWAFRSLLAVDAVALGLDYAALLLGDDPENYLTIGIGVGGSLLACVTFRPLGSILAATIGLTAISLTFLGWQSFTEPQSAAFGFAQLVLTVMPAFAGIVIVRSFGQLVQRELDRTVIESTIDAPRFGLGLLASSELARLDLAAEELLQDVATGRVDLPLDRELASTASSLATDLRRTLVAGRRETWLHHAITESEYLAPAVTLSDPGGLAGYLEPVQRDGLLSAIWLIVDESGRSNPTIDLSVNGQDVPSRSTADDRMGLPIVMSVGGIARRRIDPAVWSALSRVGQYSVDARAGRLRVSVDAHVVVPDASR
ncbi:hypothetical protein N1027_13985 [Herbiconiux sp. CPCC 205763]|uniref:Uncharacterized protein n=1 Tax=Herbiconiux aconitum TaxID=2970913 RepID=A0ABT2GSP5_9MICO|nr:hypothetical protein [Herbiconiux aconitum]MCS5719244.1 hypothetical protein [Herbiconiux aconitum]